MTTMTQVAPWPGDLEVLVCQLKYRSGWRFTPGNDPYFVFEVGTDEGRRTSFKGEVNA